MALAVYIIVAASVVCTLLGWMNVLRLFLGLLVLGWMMNITGCGTWMDFNKAKDYASHHQYQNDQWVELAVSPSRKLDTIDALVAHSHDRPFTPRYLYCRIIQEFGYDADTGKYLVENMTYKQFVGEHKLNFTAVAESPVTLDRVTWKKLQRDEHQDIQMKRMSFKVISDRGLDTLNATIVCGIGESWSDFGDRVDASGHVTSRDVTFDYHPFQMYPNSQYANIPSSSTFVYIP